jgi:hypothetical protein
VAIVGAVLDHSWSMSVLLCVVLEVGIVVVEFSWSGFGVFCIVGSLRWCSDGMLGVDRGVCLVFCDLVVP